MKKIKNKTILPSKKARLIFLAILAALLIFLSSAISHMLGYFDFVKGMKTQKYFFPEGYEISAWLWRPPDEMDDETMNILLEFAKKEGINKIYLDISKYIDIVEGENNTYRGLARFTTANKKFINKANSLNISVEALVGDSSWSRDHLSYIPLSIMDYVLTYNYQNPEAKFAGIQFDIEFYNQKDYAKNKQERMLEFLNLTKEVINKAKKYNLKQDKFDVGFAMPYWLEDNKNNFPPLKYAGDTNSFMENFFSLLEEYPNSYVVLMAYRNKAEGRNGVINIVSEELNYLKNKQSNTKIVIAQETTIGEGPHTTYMRKSEQELKRTLNIVVDKYQDFENLAGFAIHDLPSYQKLTQKK